MKKHIKFPSVEQFRNVVANINRTSTFVGLDENGDAIYDPSLKKPTLSWKGTIKLHGTNAGVSANDISGLWVQSRTNIITPQNDNAGFAFFVESKKSIFEDLINQVKESNNLDLTTNTVTIFGEWAGNGIQKGVAITSLDKSFFIFGVKITPHTTTEEELKANPAYWVDHTYLKSPDHKIYNLDDYQTFNIEIDFNHPELSQNKIIELTTIVENECPVAKAFGHSGIGEGIVFTTEYKGNVLRFKSKGEKHAKSKVKTLKKVDNEKINKLISIAEKVTPSWRLEQMLSEACDLINGGQIDRKKLGDYIRMVINDIVKEDMDILIENNVEIKEIGKYVSDIARRYFFDQELL